MSRKKVKLAWIANDSARKARFRKRKKNLLKKVSELATLCDVGAFVIVYGPNNNEPDVWPSRPVVEELLSRFWNVPEADRGKKMMDQEAFLMEMAAKVEEQLRNTRRTNFEMKSNDIMHQIQNGKPLPEFEDSEVTGLMLFLEERMKEIRIRIGHLEPDAGLPPCALAPHLNNGNLGLGENAASDKGLSHVSHGMLQHHENITGGSSRNKMGSNVEGIRLMGVDIGGSSNTGGGQK